MIGQSLAEGAAGIALLHLETGDEYAVLAQLEQAAEGGVTVADNASLYFGAPALAFVLAATDKPHLARARALAAEGTGIVTRRKLEAAHRRIDQRRRPHYAEFDLIRGLTGLGVALRRLGDVDLLRAVLAYLVRLTEPIGPLPGWWCPSGPRRDRPGPPGGHSNHGIAHGITGPLALLALARLDGLHVDDHLGAMMRILRWLDTWQRRTFDGSAWWPPTLDRADLDLGTHTDPGPGRPSWCYGTPGISRTLQLAARALGDPTRQNQAEAAFIRCIDDPARTRLLTDQSLCHGTAGLMATGRRIAADALVPVSVEPLLELHRTTTRPSQAGLLNGRAGADLALVGTATSWDACLLLC
ncbi:lanthionine synthetase C family protein [Actinocorallia longicatena]|uniref:lanthionine synthetase C family protein n=1 Tax=Actinocorallia longicatena TaxID=111803 RepID=UPI003CD08836